MALPKETLACGDLFVSVSAPGHLWQSCGCGLFDYDSCAELADIQMSLPMRCRRFHRVDLLRLRVLHLMLLLYMRRPEALRIKRRLAELHRLHEP